MFVHVCCCLLAESCLFCDPMDHSLPGSLSMAFSRHKYWGELPFPSPGDLPNPRIEPMISVAPALSSGFFTTEPPGKPILQLWHQAIKSYKKLLGLTIIVIL